ncbi:MAG: lysine biosynthesis protein LysW [Anaerolineae bacterium]|jgi:lysine biosynthesis protein LysW
MPYAVCPACDEDVHLPGRPRMGDVLFCPSCEAELEVVSTNPLDLDWRLEDDDDYDYDEEDDLLEGDEDEDGDY